MPWVPRGVSNGTLTTRWPKRPDEYFDGFPGSMEVDQGALAVGDVRPVEAAAHCPTAAISVLEERVLLDRGRCILCGRCAAIAPEVFRLREGAGTAALARRELIAGREGLDDLDAERELSALRLALDRKVRALRRSVHIRHLDAGSDGSDEWEIQALAGPVYDIHRLGIFFTASPRHADILLVTGIGAAGMREALRKTRHGMPDPVVVIATGADAVAGGLIGGGYADGSGVSELLDVDVWIPGSPASPFSLMHGILLALGRLRPAPRSSRSGETRP